MKTSVLWDISCHHAEGFDNWLVINFNKSICLMIVWRDASMSYFIFLKKIFNNISSLWSTVRNKNFSNFSTAEDILKDELGSIGRDWEACDMSFHPIRKWLSDNKKTMRAASPSRDHYHIHMSLLKSLSRVWDLHLFLLPFLRDELTSRASLCPISNVFSKITPSIASSNALV